MGRFPFVILYMLSSAGIWATHIWFYSTQAGFSRSVLPFLTGSPESFIVSRTFMMPVGQLVQIALALARGITIRKPWLVLLPVVDVVITLVVGFLSFVPVGHVAKGNWLFYAYLLGAPILCGLILDPLCCILGWSEKRRVGAQSAPLQS